MKTINAENMTKRWKSYRLANASFPNARKEEFKRQLELTDAKEGETILEIGTGNGFLTFALAKKVGKNGRIITYDYHKANLDFVNANNIDKLHITTIQQTDDYGFDLTNESVDKVSTIASLHHYDNRSKETGIVGREKIINEFYRVLKKGGKLILADVAHGTAPQRHFDSVDNPIDCAPYGHPHDFLTKEQAMKLCKSAGFKNINFVIKEVPWEFSSEDEGSQFLHGIHNSVCSAKETFEHAKRTLKWWKENDKYYLEWQLFYLTAEK